MGFPNCLRVRRYASVISWDASISPSNSAESAIRTRLFRLSTRSGDALEPAMISAADVIEVERRKPPALDGLHRGQPATRRIPRHMAQDRSVPARSRSPGIRPRRPRTRTSLRPVTFVPAALQARAGRRRSLDAERILLQRRPRSVGYRPSPPRGARMAAPAAAPVPRPKRPASPIGFADEGRGPASTSTSASSVSPSPNPPHDSGTRMASQPSSAARRQARQVESRLAVAESRVPPSGPASPARTWPRLSRNRPLFRRQQQVHAWSPPDQLGSFRTRFRDDPALGFRSSRL